MGDRAVFVCHSSRHWYSPGVYIHWGGKDALTLLLQAASRMRKGDESCSAARLCGVLHNLFPENDNASLRLLDPPLPGPDGQIDWNAYSHGDAGCILIDVDTGKVECIAGYLEGQTIGPLDLPE